MEYNKVIGYSGLDTSHLPRRKESRFRRVSQNSKNETPNEKKKKSFRTLHFHSEQIPETNFMVKFE